MVFERKFSNISELKKEPLYKKLENDIHTNKASEKVFPAIRKNEIHFYYKGGRLFKYSGRSFKTHLKYAFVCDDKETNRDVTTSVLKCIEVADFTNGYKRIKERCALYNKGLESLFVSKLFQKYSYVTSSENIVLLDIEAALTTSERADMVLYDRNNQRIKFVEAKLFSNGELRSSKQSETVPNEETTVTAKSVIDQIERYEDTITKNENDIKKAYKNYIDIVNELFGLKIPNDKIKISKKAGLIFFDFNGNDVNSKAVENKKKELSSPENKYKKIDERNIYAVGDTNDASLGQLFLYDLQEEEKTNTLCPNLI